MDSTEIIDSVDSAPVEPGDTIVLRMKSTSRPVDDSKISKLMSALADTLKVNVIALPADVVDTVEIHENLDSVKENLEATLEIVNRMIDNRDA